MRRLLSSLFLLMALMALLPSAGADGPVYPYLRLRADPSAAETDEVAYIRIESLVAGLDESGNLTLLPSSHLINWTVTDTKHNVVIARGAVPLFLGEGSFQVYIEPLWSTTLLNVTAIDYASGMIAFVDIRTHYSDDYFVYMNRVAVQGTVTEPIERLLADNAASRNYGAWMTGIVIVLFLVLLVVLFLKLDHKRSHEVFAPSYADRMRLFFWQWTMVDDFLADYFDPAHTWDMKVAEQWQKNRLRASIREMRAERHLLRREILQAKAALREPSTILDSIATVIPEAKPVNP